MKKSKHLVLSILRRAALVIAAGIIGVNLYLWNANSLVGDQLPMPFGYGAAVVLTGSMGETLPVDSLIFVREQSTCTEGQIVVYQSSRSLIVHRVVSVDGDTLITRGDANNANDEPISMSDIRGVVVGHIPMVGAVVRAIKTPLGMLCILALAICLVEIPHLREKKEDEKKKEEILAQIRALKTQQPAPDDTKED